MNANYILVFLLCLFPATVGLRSRHVGRHNTALVGGGRVGARLTPSRIHHISNYSFNNFNNSHNVIPGSKRGLTSLLASGGALVLGDNSTMRVFSITLSHKGFCRRFLFHDLVLFQDDHCLFFDVGLYFWKTRWVSTQYQGSLIVFSLYCVSSCCTSVFSCCINGFETWSFFIVSNVCHVHNVYPDSHQSDDFDHECALKWQNAGRVARAFDLWSDASSSGQVHQLFNHFFPSECDYYSSNEALQTVNLGFVRYYPRRYVSRTNKVVVPRWHQEYGWEDYHLDARRNLLWFSGKARLYIVPPDSVWANYPCSYIEVDGGSCGSVKTWKRECKRELLRKLLEKTQSPSQNAELDNIHDFLSGWLLVTNLSNTKSTLIRGLLVAQFLYQFVRNARSAFHTNILIEIDKFLVDPSLNSLNPSHSSFGFFHMNLMYPQMFKNLLLRLGGLGLRFEEPQQATEVNREMEEVFVDEHFLCSEVIIMQLAAHRKIDRSLLGKDIENRVRQTVSKIPTPSIPDYVLNFRKVTGLPSLDLLVFEKAALRQLKLKSASRYLRELEGKLKEFSYSAKDMEAEKTAAALLITERSSFSASMIFDHMSDIKNFLFSFADYLPKFGDKNLVSRDPNQAAGLSDILVYLKDIHDAFGQLVSFRTVKCFSAVIALLLFVSGQAGTFSWAAFREVNDQMQKVPILQNASAIEHLIASLRWIASTGIALYQGKLDLFANTNINKWLQDVQPYRCHVSEIQHINFDPVTGIKSLSIHNFYKRLDELKCQGEACLNNARLNAPSSVKEVISALSAIQCIRDKLDAFCNTNQAKAAPFSVLLVGGSKIGKSSLVNTIRVALQTHMDLPTEQHYTYTVPPSANFMDGFVTSHHTAILDDMAAALPRAGVKDLTVELMVQLVNNMAMGIEKAAVDEKGKHAWVGRLVLGTTNTRDLNVGAYFTTPAAALRRMPIVVSVKPKHVDKLGQIEYRDTIPYGPVGPDGKQKQLPNHWTFVVERCLPGSSGNVFYEEIGKYDNMVDFLELLTNECDAHDRTQNAYLQTLASTDNLAKCNGCCKLNLFCKCSSVPPVDKPQSLDGLIAAYYNRDLAWLAPNLENSVLFWLFQVCIVVGASYVVSFLVSCGFFVGRATSSAYCYILNFREQVLPSVDNAVVVYSRFRQMERFVRNNKWYLAGGVLVVAAGLLALISFLSNLASSPAQVLDDIPTASPESKPPASMWSYCRDAPSLSQKSKTTRNGAMVNACVGLAHSIVHVCINWLPTEMDINSNEDAYTHMRSSHGYGCILGDPYPGKIVVNKHTLKAGSLPGRRLVSVTLTKASTGKLPNGTSAMVIDTIPADNLSFVEHKHRDIAIINVPKYTNRNGIYAYMLRDRYAKVPSSPILLGAAGEENDITSIVYDNVNTDQEYCYYFKSNPTRPGDCGRPLVGTFDGYLVVLGLHSAGDEPQNRGKAMGVPSSLIDEMLLSPDAHQSIEVLAPISMPDLGSEEDLMNAGIEITQGNKHCHVLPEYLDTPVENLEYLGNTGRLASFKSDIVEPRFKAFFSDFAGEPEKIVPNLNPKDKTIGWKPGHLYVTNVGARAGAWDVSIINQCVDSLTKWFDNRLTKSCCSVGPLSKREVYNGLETVGLESLNMKTGYGFPELKKKIDLFNTTIEEGNKHVYTLDPTQEAKFDAVLADLEDGKGVNFVVNAARKDEPIKPKKMLERGCRLIFAAPTIMTCCLRYYFGCLIHMLYMNRLQCGIAVGINCRNVEWTYLFKYLTAVGTKCIAGDFANFDQKLPAIITGASLQILYNVNVKKGLFNHKQCLGMMTLLKSMMHHVSLIDCCLYRVCGPNPSGQALTTQTNCLSVLVMLLYVWLKVGYEAPAFFEHTRFTTYGDDHVICVSDGYELFNYDSIARILGELGLQYTTFDKSSAIGKDYDSIYDVQFLKCSFNPVQGVVLAPIDISSIKRRLYLSKKPSGDPIQHELDTLSSVWNDAFLHRECGVIQGLISTWCEINRLDMDDGRFPSVEQYVQRINASSEETIRYYSLDCTFVLQPTLLY